MLSASNTTRNHNRTVNSCQLPPLVAGIQIHHICMLSCPSHLYAHENVKLARGGRTEPEQTPSDHPTHSYKTKQNTTRIEQIDED